VRLKLYNKEDGHTLIQRPKPCHGSARDAVDELNKALDTSNKRMTILVIVQFQTHQEILD
jgi:hypothetical protein